MYTIKNLTEKSLKQDLLEEFLDFVNEELKINKPYSVYFVEDKHNASDALGKTAMYNPSTNSVYIYVTNRHPKDILRSIAHELVHHKQHCNGDLENMPLEKAEVQANAGGYLLRQFEDGRKNKQTSEPLNEVAPLVALGLAALATYLLPGDTSEDQIKNRLIRQVYKARAEKRLTAEQAKKLIKYFREDYKPYGNVDVESAALAIDLVGIVFPPADLLGAAVKFAAYKKFSSPPHDKEKIKFPFDIEFLKSDFYFFDMLVSLASAGLIGQPLKLALRALKAGVISAKDAIKYSKLMLVHIPKMRAFLSKQNAEIFRKGALKLTEIEAKLKKALEFANMVERYRDVLKAPVSDVVNSVNSLGPLDRFEFLVGMGPVAARYMRNSRGQLVGAKVGSAAAQIARAPKIYETWAIEASRRAAEIVTKILRARLQKNIQFIQDLKNFDDIVDDLVKIAGLSEKGQNALKGLPDSTKKLLIWIESKVGKANPQYQNALKEIAKQANKAGGFKPGDAVELLNQGTGLVWNGFLKQLGIADKAEQLSKITWNRGEAWIGQILDAQVKLDLPSPETLQALARKLIGGSRELAETLQKASKTVEEVKALAEKLAKAGDNFDLSKLTAREKELMEFFKYGDDFIGAVYNKFLGEFIDKYFTATTKFGEETAEAMAREAMAATGRTPVALARRLKVRAAASLARKVGSDPVSVSNFLQNFYRIVGTNFLGKGYVSGTYILNGKFVNGALKLFRVSEKTSAKVSGPIGRVMSATIASALFAYLRVLKPMEIAGGGGQEAKKQREAQAEKIKNDLEAAQEVNKELKDAPKIVYIQVDMNPDGTPKNSTLFNNLTAPQVPNKLKKTAKQIRVEAAKTDNPEFTSYVNNVAGIFDELAEDLEKAKTDAEKAKAAKEARRKAQLLADLQNRKTKEKANQVTKKSPSATGALKGSETKDRKANRIFGRAERDAAEETIRTKPGSSGSGLGGGVGAGIGGGIGDGIGEGGPLLTSLVRYVDERLGEYDVEKGIYLSTADKSKRKTHADSGIKDVPKQLGDLLVNAVIKYRLKELASAAADKVILDPEIIQPFAVSDKLEDIKKYNEFLKWLRSLNRKLNTIQKLKETKSLTKYRQEVLNERLEKLTKGLTK